MLTRIRPLVKKLIRSQVKVFVKIGISPNVLTLTGLTIAFLVPFTTYYVGPLLGALVIILSAYFDVIDGEVARISGRKTLFGAFLDSTIDRIEDFLYSLSLIIVGVNPILVLVLVATSFLISYTRARAEALNLKMEGIGLIERAERIILITIALALSEISITVSYIIVVLLIALSIITVLQRVLYVYNSIKEGLREDI